MFIYRDIHLLVWTAVLSFVLYALVFFGTAIQLVLFGNKPVDVSKLPVWHWLGAIAFGLAVGIFATMLRAGGNFLKGIRRKE